MVGKNNTQERFRRNATKDKRYTLKKLSVGLASVALGTVLFLNGAETVSAEAEVVDPNTPAAQPVQETFQFNYLNQATGARLDGFFGDYVNANEAEKAFRHYANEQGYTLLNVRLEGHTFTADVAVEQEVQPEAQPAESTFQFIYRNKETGEKFDSFFGDYVNENEAEKDFRHYANQHGYTLLNVRLEGHTFTADVAVEQEAQPAESAFQFIYRDKETGEKFDSFFGDYENENEAEKDFRHYANQHGYTLLNVRQNGHTFTADVARDSQSEETPEVEKGYSYALNFDGRTESANLGEFDSEEQAELALRIFANEQGYELSNLRLEGRTFHADAKVATEADEPSESTGRYLQEAKDRARGIINNLDNLFDTQKPSYLERIEDADSVAAVEAIVEEAQNYVNEGKGGENGQAPEQPEKPEYNQTENLVTYDLQITDQNGRTQTQRVTFPSRELALNYISQLVRSYEKAGVVLNEERSDVEGKDNTFILVFEEKQAEEPAKADYTVKVIIDGEERQSQALPDATRQEAIDYAERLANSYEQDGFTYNHLDAGLPSDTVIRIELSSPELDVPSHTEDAPAPEALDVTKAEALDIIAGLDLDDVIKDNLVYEINQAEDEAAVGQVIAKAYKIVAAGLAEEPTPELDLEEEAGRELDAAKAEALDAIAGLEHLSEEEKAGFVERINETTELGEVNRLVGLAFKRNIENFPEKTPELDPEEEAGRELDAAKAEALDAIAGLEYLSEEEKAGFVDRINETTELGEVNRLVGLAFKRNIENFPETTPELDPEEEAGRELDAAKAEALDAIAGLEHLSEEEKTGFVDRINETTELGEVNRLVGLAFKRNIENFPEPTPELDPEEEAGRELDAAKAEALDAIAGLEHLSEEEKAGFVDRINETTELGEVNRLVGLAFKRNIENFPETTPELDPEEEAGRELDTAKAEALDAIAGLEHLSEEEKAGFVDRINETTELGEVNRLVGLAFKRNIESFPESTPELDPEEEAGRELDVAKAEALEDIANLDYFTADEKQDLVDRINDYDNTGDIDFIVSKAIEENDARHKAAEALKAHKEKAIKDLKAKGFNNEFIFDSIRRAKTSEGVDSIVENLDLSDLDEEAGRKLDAAKADALADIAELDYYTADEKAQLENLVNSAENVEDIAIINEAISKAIEENDARHKLHKALIESGLGTNPNEAPEDLDELTVEDLFESGDFDSLAEAKFGALEDIAGLDYFTAEEKQELADRINGYDNTGDIDLVVSKAIEENDRRHTETEAELKEAKDTLRSKIEAVVDDEDQKATFLEELEAAKTLEDVQEIEDLVDIYLGVEDAEELEEEKDRLRNKVASVVEDEADKVDFLQAIDDAKTIEDLVDVDDKIEESLEADADDIFGPALATAKEGALADIAGLDYYTADEKAELEDLVNNVDNVEDIAIIDEAISKAIEENDRRHTETKQDALKELHAKATEKANEIDQRIDLTEEEKDLAHTVIVANYEAGEEAINNATTAEEVAEAKQAGIDSLDQITIDGEAKQDALKELHAKATEKANEIDQRIDLTEEEKDLAHTVIVANYEAGEEAINNATTAEEVAEAKQAGIDSLDQITIDGEAKQDALKELHAKATEKANEIDQRIDLTEEEKDLAHTVITANYEAGEEAINNATTAEEVAEAKQAGIDSLDQITIDGEAKQDALKELHAKATEKANEIDQRIDLTEEEKDLAHTVIVANYEAGEEAINNATTAEEVAEAKQAGIDSLDQITIDGEAKQDALKELHAKATEKANEIDQRIDLTEEEKDLAHTVIVANYEAGEEAINNATTAEEVAEAKQAGIDSLDQITIDGEAKQDALKELHAKATEKANEIDQRIDLTEEEKDLAHTVIVANYEAGEEAINNATTAEEVAEAKQAGIDSLDQITIDGEAKQDALKELHAKATEKANEIDQRIDLTEEEKDLAHTVITANYEAGEEAINNATTAEEVAEAKQAGIDSLDQITIDGEAKQDALKELHAKATEKANEIDQRIDLTEEEKDLAHTVITANYEAGEEAINNATTAEEVAEAKQAGIDSLDQITIDGEAKQDALKELHAKATEKANEIDQRIDLTEEEKDLAHTVIVANYEAGEEAINNATTAEEVAEAKQAGLDSLDQITIDGEAKQDALKELHAKATEKANEIDQRIDLTEEEKDLAHTVITANYEAGEEAINNATTAEEVAEAKQAGLDSLDQITIDGEAKQEALKELHAKATEKANEIDQRIDLTEEEKDLAHTVIVANYEAGEEAINNATTAEEVAEAKQAGIDSLDQITIDGEAKQDALKELHAKATEKANEIDQRIDLTEEEKDLAHTVIVANYEAGEEAINNATTAEEVAEAKQAGLDSLDQITIDGEAKQDALKELHAKATEKTNEIDQRIDLTEEEKDLAHTVIVANYEAGEEAINNATTAEEVAEAKQAGLDSLDQITIDGDSKQVAKDLIDSVSDENLNPKRKKELKDEIDQAESIDQIDEVIGRAEAEATDNLLSRKKAEAKNGDSGIDSLTDLSEETRNNLKDQIDAAENEEEILEILAKAGNRNELNKEVKEAIDGIPELTDDQRDKYKKEVEEATSDDEVESVLSELENQAYENYKGEAKDNIDALPGLTDDQKEQLKGEVDEAANSIEVGSVLDKAEKQAFENYKGEAKTEAVESIEKLKYVSNTDKENYIDRINNAEDISEINSIVGEAHNQNISNLPATDLGYENEIHVAPGNINRTDIDGNPRAIDSTGIPALPEGVEEDGAEFHFGEKLPEGFKINGNPKWHGVEEIVFEGENESKRILFRLNKENGKVEVEAGANADYDKTELPIEYVGTDGVVRGEDTVSILIRPASPTDDSDQTPGQGDGDSTEDSSTGEGTSDEGATSDQGTAGETTPDQTDPTEETDPATDEDTEEAPADEPKDPFEPSAVDTPVLILGSDSSGASVNASEHDKIKQGVNKPEGSTLDITPDAKVKVGQDGQPRVDVTVTSPDGTETKTVSVPVKQDLNTVVNNKLNDLATHANNKPKQLNKDTVTVKDQEEFRTYNETLNKKKDEIQKLLNDDANAEKGKKKLTEQQRKNLQDKLNGYNPIAVPRTEKASELYPNSVRSKQEFNTLNIFIQGKAVSAKIGYRFNSEDNEFQKIGTGNNGMVGYVGASDSLDFDAGDDELIVERAIEAGPGGKTAINMGAGNDRVVLEGDSGTRNVGTNRALAPDGQNVTVDGGDGRDTLVLRNNNRKQGLLLKKLKNFEEISLEGKEGVVLLNYEDVKESGLGGIRISGERRDGNSVGFDRSESNSVGDNGLTSENGDVHGWRAVQKRQYNGKTYVVWRHKDAGTSTQHDVWIQDTLGIRR
ncbi:DUF1542 domain-containing protein [Dolosigranulum pigrum]|uniref:DUF1542 domain-containing protein n=2 Tax=Dolosigranulum pigrum TaxID=29394 RepID=UPI001AD89A20|nr:DUF1542 domain-containing protein [Dolosigranulum pigrum]QTJ57272.1 DUF1542 domain-containing protein [Dolosigranulum pigrum]